jgi:hypothetical protein
LPALKKAPFRRLEKKFFASAATHRIFSYSGKPKQQMSHGSSNIET